MRSFRMLALGATLLTLATSACTLGESSTPSSSAVPKPTVTIGSAGFDESRILAEIYAQALEGAGYDVERQFGIGERALSQAALESGEIDLMPEYIGSLAIYLGAEATQDTTETHNALAAALEAQEMTVLNASDAVDADAWAVTQETAQEHGLTTMSDLAAMADEFVWGLAAACVGNDACGPGLLRVYGIDIATLQVENLDPCSGEMAAALNSGAIDVAQVCTSQAEIQRYNLVVLEDDGGLAPAQNIAPVVRNDLLAAAPDDLEGTLNAVSAALTTEELTVLNLQVSINQEPIEEVVAAWLADNGLA